MKKILKGGLFGFLVSIPFVLLNTFVFYGSLGAIFYPLNWLLFDLMNLFNLQGCGESCWFILILISDLEFLVFFTLIGVILSKLRK